MGQQLRGWQQHQHRHGHLGQCCPAVVAGPTLRVAEVLTPGHNDLATAVQNPRSGQNHLAASRSGSMSRSDRCRVKTGSSSPPSLRSSPNSDCSSRSRLATTLPGETASSRSHQINSMSAHRRGVAGLTARGASSSPAPDGGCSARCHRSGVERDRGQTARLVTYPFIPARARVLVSTARTPSTVQPVGRDRPGEQLRRPQLRTPPQLAIRCPPSAGRRRVASPVAEHARVMRRRPEAPRHNALSRVTKSELMIQADPGAGEGFVEQAVVDAGSGKRTDHLDAQWSSAHVGAADQCVTGEDR